MFPLLKGTRYSIIAAADFRYNCIAWAVGLTNQWWWPTRPAFWPFTARTVSVEAFIAAFASQGFELCADAAIERGYSKIALYVDEGFPTHAARIDASGNWSSKLGGAEVIEHEPHALNGSLYGSPAYYFRKKV